MAKVEYELLPKKRKFEHNVTIEISLYPYADELCQELSDRGLISRIKKIPQLGVIKVKKSLSKNRYDYVMLQLYFHKLIKEDIELQRDLKWTYNSKIKASDFSDDINIQKESAPTIGEVIQVLTMIYNIGHFYKTFTSSRAVLMAATESKDFSNKMYSASADSRFKSAVRDIVESNNYRRVHLLNSILALEQCDQNKESVLLALEILYAYLNESSLKEDSKLHYAFFLFRTVRTVSYIAYDLQVAQTPLSIDLCNQEVMRPFLKEILSEYNDRQPAVNLINSMIKLLNDTVYNEQSEAIHHYQISKTIRNTILKDEDITNKNYFNDYFLDKDSPLNCMKLSQTRDYDRTNILKLTFSQAEHHIMSSLLYKLEHTNLVRVGHYSRNSGDQTLLVSIKENIGVTKEQSMALKVLRYAIFHLNTIENVSVHDDRFLLCVKFFLTSIFGGCPIDIKPTISPQKCVICTRGGKRHIGLLDQMLKQSVGNADQDHEVEYLKHILASDTKKDVKISIPASIIVFKKESPGKTLCEFDGIIIYPNRVTEQIIFLEAKNQRKHSEFAKNCLCKKFDDLGIKYLRDDVRTSGEIGRDAFYKYTIQV